MRWLLTTWVSVSVAIAVAVGVLPGISIDWSPFSYAILAAVWGLVNVTIGTLLRIVSTPLLLITLGLFSLVINAGVLIVVAQVSDALSVDGFFDALLAALVISIVNAVMMAIWHRRRRQERREERA